MRHGEAPSIDLGDGIRVPQGTKAHLYKHGFVWIEQDPIYAPGAQVVPAIKEYRQYSESYDDRLGEHKKTAVNRSVSRSV